MFHFISKPHRIIPALRAFWRAGYTALFSIILLAFAPVAMAGSGKLALVVGNQAYQYLPPLANSGNDARGVADALRRLGFEVTLLTDVSTEVFNVVLGTFTEQAKTADAVVFYYSGHAFQLNGQNHLLPVSAKPDEAGSVEGQTWQLDTVVSKLQDPAAQTLIFLDACRTSPIEGRAGMQDGLAQMQTRAGTFISFATRPGAVSFDGDGRRGNSPYTAALLDNMEKPGLSVSDLMIKVRNDVEAATDGKQTPWDQSSLRAQFFFNPAAAPIMPVFEVVQSDTIISPPVSGEVPQQMAALEPPKPGPMIQKIEAQDQAAVVDGAETRAVPTEVPPAQPVVAAAAPLALAPTARKSVTAALTPPQAATETAPPLAEVAIPDEDLPRAVQAELKRVGCYLMGVDGDWGNGSRRALSAYLEKSGKETTDTLEPTLALYQTLLKEPEGICPPVAVTRVPKTAKKTVVKRKSNPKAKSAAAPAEAAPAKKGRNCTFLLVAIVCK